MCTFDDEVAEHALWSIWMLYEAFGYFTVYSIISLDSGEKISVMKQLRSKRLRIKNKYSVFSADLSKIEFGNMKYVITLSKKMQRHFYLI